MWWHVVSYPYTISFCLSCCLSFVVSFVFSGDFCVCVIVFGSLILISRLKRAVAGEISVDE